ncbi:Panacea domain-containing protein ['Camptotheca acuminata' phytoplasma]|uniref:Panacea domain-containing protein n=1 Tax='Camptotheca acuminata' phytoplasma TaxID=3239192 RepID=UPI00351A779F
MTLQKIIYYAHAFHLINYKKKLINSTLEAWFYGPVFHELYIEFCKYSYKPVKKTKKGNAKKISGEIKISIDKILEKYGHVPDTELTDKTNSEEPWLSAVDKSEDWEQNVIEDKDLEEHYMLEFNNQI